MKSELLKLEKKVILKGILLFIFLVLLSGIFFYFFRIYIIDAISEKGIHITPNKEPHLFFLFSFKCRKLSFHKIKKILNVRNILRRSLKCAL